MAATMAILASNSFGFVMLESSRALLIDRCDDLGWERLAIYEGEVLTKVLERPCGDDCWRDVTDEILGDVNPSPAADPTEGRLLEDNSIIFVGVENGGLSTLGSPTCHPFEANSSDTSHVSAQLTAYLLAGLE